MTRPPKIERAVIYLLVPPALKAQLEERAVENERSLTSECVVLLRRGLRSETDWRQT